MTFELVFRNCISTSFSLYNLVVLLDPLRLSPSSGDLYYRKPRGLFLQKRSTPRTPNKQNDKNNQKMYKPSTNQKIHFPLNLVVFVLIITSISSERNNTNIKKVIDRFHTKIRKISARTNILKLLKGVVLVLIK